MRKIVSILALSVLLMSCKSGATEATAVTNDPVIVTKSTEAGSSIKITKADFLAKVMNYEKNPTEWVYEGDLPCLVDFYADWCGPCRIASPILEELAAEYAGKIYVYKVDTDVEQELASAFGIRSLPSFLFVPKSGQPTMSSAGIARTPEETKAMFKRMIDEILLGEGA